MHFVCNIGLGDMMPQRLGLIEKNWDGTKDQCYLEFVRFVREKLICSKNEKTYYHGHIDRFHA